MMKIILILILLPCVSFAQRFTLTPTGLKDSTDTTKSYVIIPMEGKTAKQLYDKAINFINERYKNPNTVIKGKIDSEYIRYDGFANSLTNAFFKAPLGKATFTVMSNYTIEIRLKQDKVKYDIITNDLTAQGDYGWGIIPYHIVRQGSKWSGWDPVYIYDQKLNLKGIEQKAAIEDYFNNEVAALQKYLSDSNEW